MKRSIALSCLFFLCLIGTSVFAKEKSLIGETAWIEVGTVPFAYLARIDTGARVTSIHAVNVEIKEGNSVPDENIGKTISFQTTNRDGTTQQMTSIITKVSTVTNSQGTEQRYVIELPLAWKHVKKRCR